MDFPADATTQPTRAMFIPGLASGYPSTLIYRGDAFSLLTGLVDQMKGFKRFTFNKPVSVTVKFAVPQDFQNLALYTWTGSDWEKVEFACSLPLPNIDTTANTLKASTCYPGAFALFAQSGD